MRWRAVVLGTLACTPPDPGPRDTDDTDVADPVEDCSGTRWVGAWAAAPSDTTDPIAGQTLRLVVTPLRGGEVARVRLSNRFGDAPLPLASVHLGVVDDGATLRAGTQRALRVELDLSNASADLSHHAADLAVRMVRPTQASLHAQRLGAVRLGLFAHVDFLDRTGTPHGVGDLGDHVIIGPDRDAPALEGFAAAGVPPDAITLRTDSDGAQLAAIHAGVGIGVLHADVGAADPSLRPVLPDLPLPAVDAWLVVYADLRALRRVRVVADHRASHLGTRWG